MNQTYICQRCGHSVPIGNRIMHDSRCQNGQNQLSNYNQNNVNFNFNNQMNNNIVSINTSSMSNPDGTTTTNKIETFQNGMRRITATKYDQNGNIISEQIRNENPNINNNNMIFNNNINNNVSVQTSVDQFGNITETKTETFPNGQTRTTSTTRNRNGQIIGQSINSNFGGNNMNSMNNFQFNNMGMNNMMSGMNLINRRMNNNRIDMNMNNMNMNNMNRDNMNNMNNMNNMVHGMNNMNNNMNNMMSNMNNMMINMNDMLNSLFNNNNFGMMMNNMGQVEVNNGLDPTLLNNLPSTKLRDVSKLEDDKKNCIICMEDFKVDDEVIFLPCLHIFHKDCITEWLKSHDDCPICKHKINDMNNNI